MSVYMIAKIKISDREAYAKYEAGFKSIFDNYDGRLLSVDESPVVVEGEWPETRTVLIEFPSKVSAMEWYESDEYQELVVHRFMSSSADMIVIQGVER